MTLIPASFMDAVASFDWKAVLYHPPLSPLAWYGTTSGSNVERSPLSELLLRMANLLPGDPLYGPALEVGDVLVNQLGFLPSGRVHPDRRLTVETCPLAMAVLLDIPEVLNKWARGLQELPVFHHNGQAVDPMGLALWVGHWSSYGSYQALLNMGFEPQPGTPNRWGALDCLLNGPKVSQPTSFTRIFEELVSSGLSACVENPLQLAVSKHVPAALLPTLAQWSDRDPVAGKEDRDRALVWAISNRHAQAIGALLELGASMDRRWSGVCDYYDCLEVWPEADAPKELEGTKLWGVPASVLIAIHGSLAVNKTALGIGADPDLADREGKTALHYLCSTSLRPWEECLGVAKEWLAAGANPALADGKGELPGEGLLRRIEKTLSGGGKNSLDFSFAPELHALLSPLSEERCEQWQQCLPKGEWKVFLDAHLKERRWSNAQPARPPKARL